METIFTILVIILPIVFKLIGKKLEQAGQQNAHLDAHPVIHLPQLGRRAEGLAVGAPCQRLRGDVAMHIDLGNDFHGHSAATFLLQFASL